MIAMEPIRNEASAPGEVKPKLTEVGYEAGKARYDRMAARVESIKKLAFTALGAPEMAGEAAKRGWGATVDKANEIKTSVRERIEATKEVVRLKRNEAVESFLEKTRPIREFASEKRDQVVSKANEIGTATARTVAAGAEAVVAGVAFGAGVAVVGAMAVESGFRWSLAEVQAKPKEWRAAAHEGIAGMAGEIAKSLRRMEKSHSDKAKTHRASADTIRVRYGITKG